MRRVLAAWLLCAFTAAQESTEFANALEQCIRHAAAEAAASLPEWGNACMAPTAKIDIQAAVLTRTLGPIRERYGYAAALWCSFYSVRMTGAEYDPKDAQPNNPNFPDWYKTLLCPWDLDVCGNEQLGKNGREWEGISVRGAPNQNAQVLAYLCIHPSIRPSEAIAMYVYMYVRVCAGACDCACVGGHERDHRARSQVRRAACLQQGWDCLRTTQKTIPPSPHEIIHMWPNAGASG